MERQRQNDATVHVGAAVPVHISGQGRRSDATTAWAHPDRNGPIRKLLDGLELNFVFPDRVDRYVYDRPLSVRLQIHKQTLEITDLRPGELAAPPSSSSDAPAAVVVVDPSS